MTQSFVRIFIFLAIALLSLAFSSMPSLTYTYLSNELHTSLSTLQWISISFYITSAPAYILGGRLIERYSVRYIACLSCFLCIVGSAVSGGVSTGWLIAVGQGIQGAASGLVWSAMVIIACSQFPPKKMARGVAVLIAVGALIGILSSPMDGGLLAALGWRWIYLINIPLSVLAWLFFLLLDKEVVEKKPATKLSCGDVLLYFFFIVMLIYAAEVLEVYPVNWILFAITFVAAMIFLWWSYWASKKAKQPTIPYDLLKNSRFRMMMIIQCLVVIPSVACYFILPLMSDSVYNQSSFQSSMTLFYLSVGFAIASLFSEQITVKIGYYLSTKISCYLTFLATVIVLFLSSKTHYAWMNVVAVIFGVGSAFYSAPMLTYILNVVRRRERGAATGLFYSISGGVVQPFAVAVIGLIMVVCLSVGIVSGLKSAGLSLSAVQLKAVSALSDGSLHLSLLKKHFIASELVKVVARFKDSMLFSFDVLALVSSLTALIALIMITKLQRSDAKRKSSS